MEPNGPIIAARGIECRMLQTRPEDMAVERKPVAFGDLRGWIENTKHPGDSSTVTVLRDGQRQDLQVTLSERPAQNQPSGR